MKRILVPVDFSRHCEYAVEVAASLARKHEAQIVMLHMLGLSDNLFSSDEASAEAEAKYYMKSARKRFEKFLDKPYLEGLKISEIIQNYKIFSEIQYVVDENGIDLIVMGSHGTGGISEIFVGSNTEKVVRNSEVPVLVVKGPMPDYHPGKIVYAMDYRLEHIAAYQHAMKFLSQWEAEVHLVHVNLPNFQFLSTSQIRELERDFMKKADIMGIPEPHSMAFEADYTIENGLYAYAGEIGADLIAVPTHGRRGLAHFFRGSIGEDIVNHAPIPVITFSAKSELKKTVTN